MVENITFKDCKINSVIFQNDTPVNVSNNGSEIGSLNVDSSGDNYSKSYISLIGDFKDAEIILNSSCTINCEQGFKSDKPIKVTSTSPISIILSGDFTECSGLVLNGPCSILTGLNITFDTFNISVDTVSEIKDVSISGDFSECDLNVNSSCNLNLGGAIKSLNIDSGIKNQTLSLETGTTIPIANIGSLVSVSGDQDSIKALENNTLTGKDNITISSISQIVSLNTDGIAKAYLDIESLGKYKIIASISLPEEDIQIGDALIVNVE